MSRRIRLPEFGLQELERGLNAMLVMERGADEAERRAVEQAEVAEERTGCPDHPTPAQEIEAIRVLGFLHFLPYWKFIDREAGIVRDFRSLWEGQERMAAAMQLYKQVCILKAGKLGASELECAFDGYRIRFGPPNCRVHLYSMDGRAAKNMLRVVKFGMEHLPEWLQLPIMAKAAGGDTTEQIKFRGGRDDERTVISYAPVASAAIDQSAHHSHVDELARMPWPETTWSAVQSTIVPGGTCHIVSRGNGAANYLAVLWEQLKAETATMVPLFEPWTARPRYPEGEALREKVERGEIDAGAAWYAEQEAKMPSTSQLYYYAPRTAEEALAGAGEDAFIDMARFDACYEPNMPPLRPGDRDQVVLSLDAGVTNDVFAATLITRHPGTIDPETGQWTPGRERTAAIRGFKHWVPAQQAGGEVDFDEVDRWIRTVCLGGCVLGHPNAKAGTALSTGEVCSEHGVPAPHPLASGMAKTWCESARVPCPACASGQRIPRLNVVQIVYDRYELRDMMQDMERDRVSWVSPMDQGGERTQADTDLRTLLIQRELAHMVPPMSNEHPIRQHFQNAKAKIPTADDNRCRIEKRGPAAKVDLAVSVSMGVARCLYLNLKAPDRTAG